MIAVAWVRLSFSDVSRARSGRIAQVIFITVCFCLPTATPIDRETLNYTPVVRIGPLGSSMLELT